MPVSVPVAKGKVRRMNNPKTTYAANGDIIVSHREYIVDIAGSVAFASNSFGVNPGLAGVFPWLCGVAQRYESYRFDKLRFCFETESPTSATGSVLLAIDYDASDDAPLSKTQVMAYRSCVRSPPWSDCCNDSLAEDIQKRKSYYVRAGALAANQDIKLYDTGNFFLCTVGQANTNIVGEVYVEYVIRLMTPQLGDVGIGGSVYATFSGSSNAAPSATKVGNLPATAVSSGTTTSVTTYTFTQPWEGVVCIDLEGSGLNGMAATGTATSAEKADSIAAGTTTEVAIWTLSAQAGQTFIMTLSNTTITLCGTYFGQGDF